MGTPEYYEYIYCKHNGIYMLILANFAAFSKIKITILTSKKLILVVFKYNIAFFSLSCVPTTDSIYRFIGLFNPIPITCLCGHF